MNKLQNFFMSAVMATLGIVSVSKVMELTPGETVATALTVTFLFSWVWFGKYWFAIWCAGVCGWYWL